MAISVYVLVTLFLFAEAYRPPIKVFEISKTRHQDSRVDTHEYDPELTKQEVTYRNNRNLNNLAQYIIESLQSENVDDYKNNNEENLFVDKTRSLPVLILPDRQTVYRKKTRNYRFLHDLLHSALRTNGEDRTAPPRHRGNYEYHYYN